MKFYCGRMSLVHWLICSFSNRFFLKLATMNVKSIATGRNIKPKVRPQEFDQAPPAVSATVKGNELVLSESRKRLADPQHPKEIGDAEVVSVADSTSVRNDEKPDFANILSSLGEIKRDLVFMKRDIAGIKAKQAQSQVQPPLDNGDLDLLTENISKVSGRLGEIDSLRFDVQLLQRRIKRMEDERRTSQSLVTPDAAQDLDRSYAANLRRRSEPGLQQMPNGASNLARSMPPPAGPTSRHRHNTAAVSPHTTRSSPNVKPKTQSTRSDPNASTEADRSQLMSELENTFGPEKDTQDGNSSSEDREDAAFLNKYVQPSYNKVFRQTTDHDPSRYSSKRRRTDTFVPSTPTRPAFSSIFGPNTAPQPPRVAPAPSVANGTLVRDEQGYRRKPNGEIDGRSIRAHTADDNEDIHWDTDTRSSIVKKKKRRSHSRAQGPRDEEGYLLRPDGTRDKRSVLLLNRGRGSRG